MNFKGTNHTTNQREPQRVNHNFSLDETDWQLLRALQENARLSYAELGRQVQLSQPAVAERVRRLEEAGIIEGYHARVSLPRLGRSILAFVRVRMNKPEDQRFVGYLQEQEEVLECHRVTGEDCYLLKVGVESVTHLEELLETFSPYGSSSTVLALSSIVPRRTIRCAPRPH